MRGAWGVPLNNNLLFDLIEKSACDICFVQETLVRSEANIVNICAPTDRTDRKSIYESLYEYCIPASALVIGSDFNIVMNMHLINLAIVMKMHLINLAGMFQSVVNVNL